MPIHESTKNNYYTLDDEVWGDKNISLEAKGILSCVLSFGDKYSFNVKEFCETQNVGKRVAYRCLNELIQHGYAIRHQETTYTYMGQGKRKRHLGRMEYTFFDFPTSYEKRKSQVIAFANDPHFPDDWKMILIFVRNLVNR